MSTTANVALAALGGLLIGTACSVYMMVAGKVAGCSGSVKACVLATAPGLSRKAAAEPPTYHGPNILFFAGLVAAGAVVTAAAPWCFEAYSPLGENGWLMYSIGGLLVGTGTYLGNGCTSGHGLAGLSRLSLRSLAATPTFMVAASLTAMIKTQFAAGPIAPFVAMTSEQFVAYGWVVLGLCVLSIPMVVLHVRGGRGDGPQGNQSNRPPTVVYYAGAWCGLVFGAGLCFGGMARPSSISGALSPQRFDLTLWVLFTTALAVTFAGYRISEHCVGGLRNKARAVKQGPINRQLLTGNLLFGVGWGLTGMCPGPVLVSIPADFGSGNITGGPIFMLVFVILGQTLAAMLISRGCFGQKSSTAPKNASVSSIRTALLDGANVIDLRRADEREVGTDGVFVKLEGSVSAVYDTANHTLPEKCLPSDVDTPLIVMCRSGRRAQFAMNKTDKLNKYKKVLCCAISEVNEAISSLPSANNTRLIPHAHNLTLSGSSIFLQFQDPESSTFTYLIGDKETGDAVIIDPVLERLDHDLAKMKELGLTPSLAINTHCHADHITSSGKMKLQVENLKSVISESSGADADVKVKHGQVLTWANGKRTLKCISTPGHTSGCMSFIDSDIGCVFTGDCLLIDGCGRTDFQGGSSETLYASVHNELFTLDPSTLVYPGHDYKGRACSTIGHEKKYNARLSKTQAEYVDIMANLGLALPKKIDVSVPANMRCGV